MHERLEVINARPPNFDRVAAAFHGAAERGVIFAYGGKVYAPGGAKVTRDLDAHERVHIQRQGDDPDAWWDRYIADEAFRFEEEYLAHLAEYRSFCRRQVCPVKRSKALRTVCQRLLSGLYGSFGITLDQIMFRMRAEA